MRDQVLSIDQMKHLKDLNIDTSEATLYWTRRCHGCKIDDDSTGEWFLSLQKEFQVIGFISYEVIPTFTLQVFQKYFIISQLQNRFQNLMKSFYLEFLIY